MLQLTLRLPRFSRRTPLIQQQYEKNQQYIIIMVADVLFSLLLRQGVSFYIEYQTGEKKYMNRYYKKSLVDRCPNNNSKNFPIRARKLAAIPRYRFITVPVH